MTANKYPLPPGVAGMALRFRQARQHSGLTLKDLEKKSTCPISMLSDLGNGRRMPQVDSVEKIARALGVSAGWLAYGEGIAPSWMDEKKEADRA